MFLVILLESEREPAWNMRNEPARRSLATFAIAGQSVLTKITFFLPPAFFLSRFCSREKPFLNKFNLKISIIFFYFSYFPSQENVWFKSFFYFQSQENVWFKSHESHAMWCTESHARMWDKSPEQGLMWYKNSRFLNHISLTRHLRPRANLPSG